MTKKQNETILPVISTAIIALGIYGIFYLILNKKKGEIKVKEISKEIKEGLNPPKRVYWKIKEYYL